MDEAYQRENSVFEAARQLGPEERAAFLAQACGADTQLRQRLEARLQSQPQADGGGGGTTLTLQVPNLPGSQAPDEQAGDQIGRYRLEKRIGEGGMGSVWMAEQTEPIRRKVALKVVKAGLDSNQILARFEAERQALALMDHPNIAKVLDAGAAPSGRPFFVMELINGTPLITFCDEERLSIRERLELFVPICQAVQHAHQKGIIHRDLKPSNILVAAFDGRQVPKVIDFGIAKATGQRLVDGTTFTQLGAIIGTLEYMSPEQAELNQLDIDTRSDVYSLGVLLYELLTGTTPLTREVVRHTPFDEILRRIREQEPPRPSTRLSQTGHRLPDISTQRKLAPAQLQNRLRGDLDWIVMKALEKDRTRRYETANGLAMDLQRHLKNEPIAARPPTRAYRFQKFVRRNKLGVVAGGAVAASLIAGLGISFWLFLKEKAARQRTENEAAKTRQVVGFFDKVLNSVTPEVAQGRDTTLLRLMVEETSQNLTKDLSDQPEVRANLQETVGHVYVALGLNNKAEAIQREALALLIKTLGSEHRDVASAMNLLATTLYSEGKLVEAEELARKALSMRRKILGNEHPEVAESLNNLSLMLLDEDKFEEAERLQREALALSRKLHGEDSAEVASSLNNLGAMLSARGDFAGAEKLQRDELASSRRRLPALHPDLALSLNNLAMLISDQGRPGEAEPFAVEALQIRRKVLKDPHPDLAVSLNNLGRIFSDEGKFSDAEPLILEALAMRRKLPSGDPLDVAISLEDLLLVREGQGRLSEIETIAKEAMDIRKKAAPDKWQTFRTSSDLGGILLSQKRLTEAEPWLVSGFEGMKQNQKEIPVQQRAALGKAAQRLVQLYRAMDLTEKAAVYQKELEVLEAEIPGTVADQPAERAK